MQFIDNWKDAWKMLSVQLPILWGAVWTVFVALPADRQAKIIGLFGIDGAGAIEAWNFIGQVIIAYSAAQVMARVTKQPSVSGV